MRGGEARAALEHQREAFVTIIGAASTGIEVTETLIVALMLVAALVAIAADRLRLPYTVALVLVGLGLGISGAFTTVTLTSDLILLVFLPPLLFEGAFNLDLDELARRWLQVGVLAVIGTTVSAIVIAAALVVVPGMALELAVVLAVMLAATDPISVLAVFKEHGVKTGLRTLMEGESIFNDALAIVFYLVAIEVAFGDDPVTVRHALAELGTEVLVGLAAGTGVGLLAHRLMATLDDHLVEIALSLVTAYGAYLLADRLGGSGVIAVVVAGMLIGNYSIESAMSASSRVSLTEFWEVLAFLANSALFLLIGLEFHIDDLRGRTLVATSAAIVAMLVGRAVIAFGLLWPFRHSASPVPRSWTIAVFWGGLRGSIPIALVLGIPDRRIGDVDAVAVVFGVVFFSLVVQGLTYKPLLDRLGLTSRNEGPAGYERTDARTIALRATAPRARCDAQRRRDRRAGVRHLRPPHRGRPRPRGAAAGRARRADARGGELATADRQGPSPRCPAVRPVRSSARRSDQRRGRPGRRVGSRSSHRGRPAAASWAAIGHVARALRLRGPRDFDLVAPVVAPFDGSQRGLRHQRQACRETQQSRQSTVSSRVVPTLRTPSPVAQECAPDACSPSS